jgi:hypothetical protein
MSKNKSKMEKAYKKKIDQYEKFEQKEQEMKIRYMEFGQTCQSTFYNLLKLWYLEYIQKHNPIKDYNWSMQEIMIDNQKFKYYNHDKKLNACFVTSIFTLVQNNILSIEDIYGAGLLYCMKLSEHLLNEDNYIWRVPAEELKKIMMNGIITRSINNKTRSIGVDIMDYGYSWRSKSLSTKNIYQDNLINNIDWNTIEHSLNDYNSRLFILLLMRIDCDTIHSCPIIKINQQFYFILYNHIDNEMFMECNDDHLNNIYKRTSGGPWIFYNIKVVTYIQS